MNLNIQNTADYQNVKTQKLKDHKQSKGSLHKPVC